MNTDRWQTIKKLFREGLEREPEERAPFLEAACGHDEALRQEVQALLDNQEGEDGFLTPPTECGLLVEEPSDRLEGTQIGQYHLERLISTGGMGSVYMARQEQPSRLVAIKVMRESITSKSALRRFEYEAEILAHLDHPNIADVIEAGTHRSGTPGGASSAPYFVMEYIPGALAITDFVRVKQLSIVDRLKLFLQVCNAVHYGHQKGVIHRDLKPSNILVDNKGQVRVIDFGVARATNADIALTTLQTDVGQLLGTVQYMSPEQCRANPRDLDIRSDVYALGVVLYELLSGELPYDVRHIAVFEATRRICETEPKSPSTSHKSLRGDIETILLKALEKERSRRYQSVADYAADIHRHLEGDNILARPTGPATRTWKRIRRNPVVSATIGIALLLILSAAFYVLFFAYPQVMAERNIALEAKKEAELQRQATLNAMAEVEREANNTKTVNDFLGEVLSLADPNMEGREVKIVEALEDAVQRLDREFADMPETEASLRNSIGITYHNLGQFEEAEKLLTAAVEISARVLGENHPQTLAYRVAQGQVFRNLGRFEEAETLLRTVVEETDRIHGKEALPSLTAMAALGRILETQGKALEAETLLRHVVTHQRRILGVEKKTTIHSMNLLANVLRSQGKYAEAETLLRELLPICREQFGEDHLKTLETLNITAAVLSNLGKYKEAVRVHGEVLEARRRKLGEEHPETRASLNNLATALMRIGNYSESETMFRQVIDLNKRFVGEEHPTTLLAINNLANVLGPQGKVSEAKNLIVEVFEIRKRILGEEHMLTVDSLYSVGVAQYHEGKYAEAEVTQRRVHAIRKRDLGENHLKTLQVFDSLSMTLIALDKYAEAETICHQILEYRKKHCSEDDPQILKTMRNLALALLRQGKLFEAETIQRNVLEIRTRLWGENHPSAIGSMHDVAQAIADQERYDEALDFYLKGLQLAQENLLPSHYLIYYFKLGCGRCLAELRRFEEAEKFLLSSHSLWVADLGPDDPRINYVVNALADVYAAWDQPEKSQEWRARLADM